MKLSTLSPPWRRYGSPWQRRGGAPLGCESTKTMGWNISRLLSIAWSFSWFKSTQDSWLHWLLHLIPKLPNFFWLRHQNTFCRYHLSSCGENKWLLVPNQLKKTTRIKRTKRRVEPPKSYWHSTDLAQKFSHPWRMCTEVTNLNNVCSTVDAKMFLLNWLDPPFTQIVMGFYLSSV